MTYYKIRSETIALVFTIGGSAAASAAMPSGVGGVSGSSHLSGDIAHPLVSADWRYELENFLPSAHPVTRRHLAVSCFGASNSYNDTLSVIDGSMSGTLTCSVVCDVCLYTENPQTGTGDLAPFFQRLEDTPPNTKVYIVRVPQPNQSVTATLNIGSLTIACTGNTGSNPAPLGHQTSLEMTCAAGATIAFIQTGSPAASGSASGSITMSGWAVSTVTGKSCNTSVSSSHGSSSTSAGHVQVSSDATIAGVVGDFDTVNGATGQSEAYRTESGDRSAKLQAAIFHMVFNPTGTPGMYSDSLVALLTGFSVATRTFTGSFEESITQQQCGQTVTAYSSKSIEEAFSSDPCSDTSNLDTYSPLAATIQPASLISHVDDSQATRLMMRGKAWAALTLGQATETIVDACSALTISTGNWLGAWTLTGGGTASIVSGAVRFIGGTTLTRSFSPKGYLAGYRWLMLKVRADGTSKSLTISINGKTWSITTSATASTWLDCYIDMCLPTNGTVDVDGFDTRWPEDADGYPSEGPSYYGIGAIDSIIITGMESGVTYEIDKVALNMGDQSVYGVDSPSYGYTDTDCVSSFGPWVSEKPESVVSEAGTTTTFFLKRFLHSLPEEVGQAIEEAAFKKQVTVGGFTGVTVTTYSHPSILNIITRLNHKRYPGVVAVDVRAMPTPSGLLHPPAEYEYYNSNQYGVYMGGGGALSVTAPSGNTNPNNWFRLATEMDHVGYWASGVWVEVALSLNAQPLYDSVGDWFAGCGDVFNHKNASATDTGALLLRAASLIRGYARGIVADEDFVPLDAATVNLMQALSNRGSGESETDNGGQGEYFTGLPYPNAPISSTLEQDTRILSFTAYTRHRQRGVFLGIVVSVDEKLCHYMTSDQKQYLYYIGTTSGTTGTNLCLKRVYQNVNGEFGVTPSVGTLKTTQIAAGNFSYPSAVEFSGNYPASDIRDNRHGSGATHGVVVLNKATSVAVIYLSTDYAEDWRMETIGGTYSVASATEHNTRVIFMGWRANNWYVRVGAPRAYTGVSGSGDYEWSSEVLVVATTKKSGRLWVREDGTIHFTYLNSSEVPTIISCSNLANTGAGVWN